MKRIAGSQGAAPRGGPSVRMGAELGLGCLLLWAYCAGQVVCAAFQDRQDISLNTKDGQVWYFENKKTGGIKQPIQVPRAWDAQGFSGVRGSYSTVFPGDASWRNCRIKVAMGAVNHICSVLLRNRNTDWRDVTMGSHRGGYVPFQIDITDAVDRNGDNTLKVVVENGFQSGLKFRGGDGRIYANYPVGYSGPSKKMGIVDDVYLQIRPEVELQDAFYVYSHRNQTLHIEIEVANHLATPQMLSCDLEFSRDAQVVYASTSPGPARIAGNTTAAFQWTADISDAIGSGWMEEWFPNNPALYDIKAILKDQAGGSIDRYTVRTGLREVWVDGDSLYINGVSTTLMGTSINIHDQHFDRALYEQFMTESQWPLLLQTLLGLNHNAVRFHMSPPRSHVLDACDRQGMMVVAESALIGKAFLQPGNTAYLANARQWIREWVKRDRNHPSIVMWSAANEMNCCGHNLYSNQTLLGLGKQIAAYDTIDANDVARPVTYNGDFSLQNRAENKNVHYYPSIGADWPGNHDIYSHAASFRHANKPTIYGEFLAFYRRAWDKTLNKPHAVREVLFMQGLMTRGSRYVGGFVGIFPYTTEWAWRTDLAGPPPGAVTNLKNSFAPVAAFHRDYDSLGVDHFLDPSKVPVIVQDKPIRDRLILYNQDFPGSDPGRDNLVSIAWQLRVAGQVMTSGRDTVFVALGEFAERDLVFSADIPSGTRIDLELKVWKYNSPAPFLEVRSFDLLPFPGKRYPWDSFLE